MKTGHAIRHGDWKLIVADKKEPQLFDLASDPYEKRNLAKDEPERVAELQRLLAEQQALDVAELPQDLVGLPN